MDHRPARRNRPWQAYCNNDIGVDEFIALCRKLNAEPYICVNVGTGTPEEAAALVAYTNGTADSTWGRLRARNGHPEPYGVKTWNVGNEEYLPNLGSTCGELYAQKFMAFARAMRAADPSIELVAVGAFDLSAGAILPSHPAYRILRYLFDWNKEVLPVAGPAMSAYAIHHYEPNDSVKGLGTEEINRYALAKAEDLAAKLDRLHREMDRLVPGGKRVPIALDEWAMWLPKEIPADASPRPPIGLKKPEDIGLHGPLLTLRDALAEAAVYNLMQRRPGDFALANRTLLYAYALGMIAIGRDRVALSPPALMLELYATQDRCRSLRTEVHGPTFDLPARAGFSAVKGVDCLDVSARLRPDGRTVELFVINRNGHDAIDATVGWHGKTATGSAEVAILNGTSLREWNSFEDPHRVWVEMARERLTDGQLRHRFPAHSLTRVAVQVPKD